MRLAWRSLCAAGGRGRPFDVVITDLGMPGLDGGQVARALKTAAPDTPVIFLTRWSHRTESGEEPTCVDGLPALRSLRACDRSLRLWRLSPTPPRRPGHPDERLGQSPGAGMTLNANGRGRHQDSRCMWRAAVTGSGIARNRSLRLRPHALGHLAWQEGTCWLRDGAGPATWFSAATPLRRPTPPTSR